MDMHNVHVPARACNNFSPERKGLVGKYTNQLATYNEIKRTTTRYTRSERGGRTEVYTKRPRA